MELCFYFQFIKENAYTVFYCQAFQFQEVNCDRYGDKVLHYILCVL